MEAAERARGTQSYQRLVDGDPGWLAGFQLVEARRGTLTLTLTLTLLLTLTLVLTLTLTLAPTLTLTLTRRGGVWTTRGCCASRWSRTSTGSSCSCCRPVRK